MKSERGYSLIECLVYIAVLAVVLNLSFVAYYRYEQHTRSLRRNADDITRALRAGERWREDVRTAIAPPHAIANGLAIPPARSCMSLQMAPSGYRRAQRGRLCSKK
jgi:Tfp pilus assembly protein PilE